ncbi:MAG: DUF1178 family protein [Betaproteobacteria bacterium]|nr:DUF1178 family protein [Betaproteobacteria bacterium]
MIVFNLSCSQDHTFDGWFRSAGDFDAQNARGLVECPFCSDRDITKQLSAPRLNVGAKEPAAESGAGEPREVMAAFLLPDLQAHMLKQFKSFIQANTENVGGQFAEVARRMHYGEEKHRGIRGRVSAEESSALREEGIETVSLPNGVFMDEGVQ